jgi:HAD superfamily hydrolase (TIGR01509 family)
MIAAVIFDVDGVLVDSPHERAWREALHELMTDDWRGLRSTWSPRAFTPELYQRLLSGRPRLDGARAALEHFRVPYLTPLTRVYADRKQEHLERLIARGDFHAYPDALRFVAELHARGVPCAAASSSHNAPDLLRRTGVTFPVDVSGRAVARGKPAPDLFLLAARELGVAPEACLVVEDAPAGIAAAKAAGMTALGIARRNDADALRAADLVVPSLDDAHELVPRPSASPQGAGRAWLRALTPRTSALRPAAQV